MKIPPTGIPTSGFSPSTSLSPSSASEASSRAANSGRRAHPLTPEQEEEQKLMKRSRQARDEATREIEMTEQHLRDAQEASAAELDRIRETASEEIQAERDRSYEAVRSQTQEGYQQLAALKRRQAEELARVQREGDSVLAETLRHYRDSIGRAEKTGSQTLKSTLDRNAQTQQFEETRAATEIESDRKEHLSRMAMMKESNDAKFAEIQAQQEKAISDARESTSLAREQTRNSFETSFAELSKKQQETIDALNTRSTREIERIREDSSEKLAAYGKRQRDPFYQLKTFDAEFEERDDAFVLRARVPVHERKNISVTVQPETVTITGNRRNVEKLEVEPGRSQSSSSFQTITETFPLSFPVDARAITRQFDGDELVVTLPKKVAYRAERRQYHAPVERSRVERPEFPTNIPIVQNENREHRASREPASGPHSLEAGPPNGRRPGGRTLG